MWLNWKGDPMLLLPELLSQTESLHRHLCPRQVLGTRIGLLAGQWLGLNLPQNQGDKRLFAFVETDGCFADGLSVATGCWLGHRTLRLMDYGKVAATLVDTKLGNAVRIVPRAGCRTRAYDYVPDTRSRWQAQLEAYQVMPDDELLTAVPVTLTVDLEAVISRPGRRVNCQVCGEEILNEREVIYDGSIFCQACAGGAYYQRNECVDYG